MPKHNLGLCQYNQCDLCQDHHTRCPDNHHDLYKQITNIYASIIINCAPTSMPISPSSMPRYKHKNMYKLHTFLRQQDEPQSMRGMVITRETHVQEPYHIYVNITIIISRITYIMTSKRYTKRDAHIPRANMCHHKRNPQA